MKAEREWVIVAGKNYFFASPLSRLTTIARQATITIFTGKEKGDKCRLFYIFPVCTF
jgi:hypothetical protein